MDLVKEQPVSLLELCQKLHYDFKDLKLLKLALSHKSHANEIYRPRSNDAAFMAVHNERLEFLGDSVLGLIISDLLFENFAGADEGKMSKVRATLVRAETLSEIATRLELGKFLLLGKGELATGGSTKESILSSTFEAVLGAVYLDGGLEAAFAVVEKQFADLLPDVMSGAISRDHKTKLQEFAQKNFRASPAYKVIQESGPDHEKTFEVTVKVSQHEQTGKGRNKKEAEQSAALAMLNHLKNLPATINATESL